MEKDRIRPCLCSHSSDRLWIYEQRELCLCLGHPQPPLSGTGVLWVSCRDPPVCHDVQGDIVTERQPLCVVLVMCCC